MVAFSLLHESEVEIKSKHPLSSKLIGTPFIKDVDVAQKLLKIGFLGKIDSLDMKFPCPSLMAIWAPEVSFSKSLVE